MRIVIDIPDGCFEELSNGQFPVQDAYRLVAWIKDGSPLLKGRWERIDAQRCIKSCSNCRQMNYSFETPYCPWCGSYMREEVDNELPGEVRAEKST